MFLFFLALVVVACDGVGDGCVGVGRFCFICCWLCVAFLETFIGHGGDVVVLVCAVVFLAVGFLIVSIFKINCL